MPKTARAIEPCSKDSFLFIALTDKSCKRLIETNHKSNTVVLTVIVDSLGCYNRSHHFNKMVSPLLQGCKLTYFSIAGRGESIRLALSIGGISQWTDDRIEFADWNVVKPTTPWGSLPVLTLQDGREIAQQRAILRMVGKETGLYPSAEFNDNFTAAKIDELMDALEDVGSITNAVGRGLPKEEKEADDEDDVSL